jgi:hypothetical protein
MTKGKNKQQAKKGGRGGKKVEKASFTKKEWYKVMSPPAFSGSRPIGWTPANKTIGKSKSFFHSSSIFAICSKSRTDVYSAAFVRGRFHLCYLQYLVKKEKDELIFIRDRFR